ncbi:MAG: hypothetical protein HOP17_11020, partial [Acidobacteria bacterium]|nr:hypothetical protein [Acidobacteriota bacterium]
MFPETLFHNPTAARTGGPEILDHDLNRYFPELLKFESTAELAASPIVEKIREDAERVLNEVVVSEPGAIATGLLAPSVGNPVAIAPGSDIAALAWNIERGSVFEGIANALQNHEDLKNKDVLLLTELDYGMARSGNRFVAKELAERLKLSYAFAPVYVALQKGSGVESAMAGENT